MNPANVWHFCQINYLKNPSNYYQKSCSLSINCSLLFWTFFYKTSIIAIITVTLIVLYNWITWGTLFFSCKSNKGDGNKYSCGERGKAAFDHFITEQLFSACRKHFLNRHVLINRGMPSCLSSHRVVSAFSASQDAAHDFDTLRRYKVSAEGSIERACPCLVVIACVVTWD